jgi:hypothetical protein
MKKSKRDGATVVPIEQNALPFPIDSGEEISYEWT